MPIFSERLKELRLENHLTTVELAKAISVSDAAITRWEKGQRVPNIIHLRNLSIYFKVSPAYLIGLED